MAELTEMARTVLTQRVDTLWTELQGIDHAITVNQGHGRYVSLRAQYTEAAVGAALSSHDGQNRILERWADMERTYAGHVRTKVIGGRNELREHIELLADEIKKLEEPQREFDALVRRTADNQRKKGDAAKFTELAPKVETKREHEEEKQKNESSLAGIDRAAGDLQTIVDMQGTDPIHYRIADPQQILISLGDGSYQPPVFSPFGVFSIEAQDVFERDGERVAERARSLAKSELVIPFTAAELPDLLKDLLCVKGYVDGLQPGANFASREVKAALGSIVGLGTKHIGNYIESAEAAFGLTGGSSRPRRFVKQAGYRSIERAEFLAAMMDIMDKPSHAEVNDFYMVKALAVLREQCKGYDGFKATDIVRTAHDIGFPMTLKAAGLNLRKRTAVYQLTMHGDTGRNATYSFATVCPTDAQSAAVKSAVPTFGYGSFTLPELCGKIESDGREFPVQVGTHLLTTLADELNLKKITDDPLTYQSRSRPSATLRKEIRPNPSASKLV